MKSEIIRVRTGGREAVHDITAECAEFARLQPCCKGIELTDTDQMFCPTQRLRRLSGSVVWGR